MEISDALKTAKNDMSCSEITNHISKGFRSFMIHDNPVEKWLFEHLSSDQIYPQTTDYVSMSIYRDPFRFYLPQIGLAPNIMVQGNYFGTDKLSHFASTGHHYYLIYNSVLPHADEDKAKLAAILYGATDEQAVHGFWASGVFSYADLEANFQGMMFYRRLCTGNDSYLKQNNGRWEISQPFKIADYVSPSWDESFNPSYYLPKNWEKISPVLKKDYCPQLKSFSVIKRMAGYQRRRRENFSTLALKAMQIQKTTPTPQSFTQLCLQD